MIHVVLIFLLHTCVLIYKILKDTAYIYSPLVDSEVVLVFENNIAGSEKLSSFIWTAAAPVLY
jgi:hypothetical protein